MTARAALRVAVEAVEARRLFAAPAIDTIANTSAPVGKAVQIPITSTSGAAVTYSVRVGDKTVKAGFRPSSNTYIQMDVAGYSQPMVFQLFNDTTPDTVRRITGLINSGYYNGLTFHRIVNNFVIQGGDPSGDGTGGPQFTFDDEFDPNTIFDGTGQLAMANSGKDTNGSQFFVTEGNQRALDFNHTIFGQLIRGEATREAISNVAVDSNDKPTTAVTITDVKVIHDNTDGVLLVKPTAAGSFNIKITATNADGSTSRSFTLTAAADTTNDPPILNKVQPVYYTSVNTPVTINLSSTDLEGTSENFFAGQYISSNNSTGSFSGTNQNTLTITPASNTTGPITLDVGVVGSKTDTSRGSTAADSSNSFNIFDSQKVTIAVGDLPISASAVNFAATAGTATGQILVGQIRDTDASGSASDFTANVDWGDGVVTKTATIKKIATGRYGVYANHTYSGQASGTEPITLTVTGNLGALATAESSASVTQAASLNGTTLTITGTSAADKISIGRKGRQYAVTVNGATQAFATGSVSLIDILGLGGNDFIALAKTVYTPANIDGGDGNDQITGGTGNDVINGGAGNDTIAAGDGDNRVAGAAGDDILIGGIGRDRLFGGDGNDSINGEAGRDILSGDAGNDTIIGAASADTLYGGDGTDVLNGLGGADSIDGGDGSDTYKFDVLDTVTNCEVRV